MMLMAVAMPVSFSTWSALLNNFVIEAADFTGVEIGWLHTVREIPGFLAIGVIVLIMFIREQALARNRSLISEMQATGIDADINVLTISNISGEVVWAIGLLLIWVAAALTAITGWDYLKKALPHLRDIAE